MKNKILMKYTLPRELLLLLGIKESEITDYTMGYISFIRNNRKFMVVLGSDYCSEDKDNEGYITLKLYDTSYIRTFSWGLELFFIKRITCDDDFEKFRKMLEIELHEPIVIDCKKNEENKD